MSLLVNLLGHGQIFESMHRANEREVKKISRIDHEENLSKVENKFVAARQSELLHARPKSADHGNTNQSPASFRNVFVEIRCKFKITEGIEVRKDYSDCGDPHPSSLPQFRIL